MYRNDQMLEFFCFIFKLNSKCFEDYKNQTIVSPFLSQQSFIYNLVVIPPTPPESCSVFVIDI